MRILLVGNYALDGEASVSRYAEMLCRNLRLRGHLVELIHPRPILGRLVRRSAPRKWLGHVDKFLLFPLKLTSAAQGFDLVHICDHANAMYLAHTGGIPASITCHDLLDLAAAQGRIPSKRVPARFRARQLQILLHLQQAKNVVCLSSKTSCELGSMHVNASQCRVVIPNAVEVEQVSISADRVAAARRRYGLADTERYLLHVGGERWFSDRLGALRIFYMVQERVGDGLKMIMAGAPLTTEMREFAAANLPQGSVIEMAGMTQDELWPLYAGAAGLLYPSLYEGFGWPIAEAQTCGCPVITSDRAPMTEVAGPAALYIDPRDEAGAANAIVAKLDAISSLCQAGLENAKRFRPEVVFASYEGFFKGLLRTRRSSDVVIAPNEAETAAAGQWREG
jgi:glycosyltransferase involved in cell wall biosynthesis